MGSLTIIVRRPPYGTLDAAEGVRHALGGVTEEMGVNLLLVDGGVQAARREQDVSGTEYTGVGEGIGDCAVMGARVYADNESLDAIGLVPADLIDDVTIIGAPDAADILRRSDTVMIF